MLVLKRRREQSVQIGEATVKVLAIEGGAVTIGITAPPSYKIERHDTAPLNGVNDDDHQPEDR